MSTLSWIIYLADIVTGLVNILIIGGAIILIATAVLLGIWSEDIDFYKHKKTYLRRAIWACSVACIMIFLAVLLPSKNAIMYIAASEYGQIALQNPKIEEVTNESFKFLQTWIKKQNKELESK